MKKSTIAMGLTGLAMLGACAVEDLNAQINDGISSSSELFSSSSEYSPEDNFPPLPTGEMKVVDSAAVIKEDTLYTNNGCYNEQRIQKTSILSENGDWSAERQWYFVPYQTCDGTIDTLKLSSIRPECPELMYFFAYDGDIKQFEIHPSCWKNKEEEENLALLN